MKLLFKILLSLSLLSGSFPSWAEDVQTISPRIVGGYESAPDAWPYMVSIKTKYTNSHFCGGTLIAPQWVLTAAHCVYDPQYSRDIDPLTITATIGEYDLKSMPVTPAIDIKLILRHQSYDPISQSNDIALLKLAVPVDYDTVAIANQPLTDYIIAQEFASTTLGWGSTVSPPATDYPDILNQVEVPLNTDQQCFNQLGANYNSTTMICAGLPEGEKDACQGDSGGPLMYESNTGWQQIGIVSWGYGCAEKNSPGVYTRLASYDYWIDYLVKAYTTFNITPSIEFSQISVNDSETKPLTIENFSDNEAHFTYEFKGSNYFSFDASACETINANDYCEFEVTYTPLDQGSHEAIISATSDIPNAITETSMLSGETFIGSSSSGSLGLFTLLLLPLLIVRRYSSILWLSDLK